MGIEGKMEGPAEVELGRTLSEITGTSFHSKTAQAVGTPAEEAPLQKEAGITKLAEIPLDDLFQNEIFQKGMADELDKSQPEIDKVAAALLESILPEEEEEEEE